MMNKQEFYNKVTEQTGIELSEKQKNQYQRYSELVVEWNQKIQQLLRKKSFIQSTFMIQYH